MKPAARILAVVVTTAALVLTGQAVQTAAAKPHPVGAHAKGGKSEVAKSDLRKVRVENYRLSVNVLRQAVRVQVAAAKDPEATALVASAVAKALTVTAAGPKSLVREAQGDLAAARDLLLTD